MKLGIMQPYFFPYIGYFQLIHAVDTFIIYDCKLYVPIFWKECLDRADGFDWEKKLTSELLPLPIDHRYHEEDMDRIVSVINHYKR